MTLRGYTRRYGVDRYTAYGELAMLGIRLPAKDQQWAVRPPSVPKRSRGEQQLEPLDDGLPCGWIEWGGEIMFVAGFTSGGAPYGVRIEEFPADDLPDELRDLAETRRVLSQSPAGHDDWGDALGGEAEDAPDVPF